MMFDKVHQRHRLNLTKNRGYVNLGLDGIGAKDGFHIAQVLYGPDDKLQDVVCRQEGKIFPAHAVLFPGRGTLDIHGIKKPVRTLQKERCRAVRLNIDLITCIP